MAAIMNVESPDRRTQNLRDRTVFSIEPKLSLPSSSTASKLEQLDDDDDDDAFSPLPSDCIVMETPVRPIPGSNSAKAPSYKRQFTYDPDTYLNVNAPSKKSKKSDKQPSLSDQVLMAQLIWLLFKTARMQKETADKGVQFDGALDLFDC